MQSTPLCFSCPSCSASEAPGYINIQCTGNWLSTSSFHVLAKYSRVLPSVHCVHATLHWCARHSPYLCVHRYGEWLAAAKQTNSMCTLKTLGSNFVANRGGKSGRWWGTWNPLFVPPLDQAESGYLLPDTRHFRPLPFNMWCLQVASEQNLLPKRFLSLSVWAVGTEVSDNCSSNKDVVWKFKFHFSSYIYRLWSNCIFSKATSPRTKIKTNHIF